MYGKMHAKYKHDTIHSIQLLIHEIVTLFKICYKNIYIGFEVLLGLWGRQ